MNENKTPKEEVPRTTREFVSFLFHAIISKKKYWLLPLWCLVAAIALVLFLTGNGALLPAIYMAF